MANLYQLLLLEDLLLNELPKRLVLPLDLRPPLEMLVKSHQQLFPVLRQS